MKDEHKTREQLIFFGCLIVAVMLVSTMLAAVPTLADQEPKQVLILNSHDYGMPWQQIVNQAIYAAFEADTSIETELHTEYTGLSQNFDDAYVQKLLDLYDHKYTGQEMDLIIAVDIAATDFLIKRGDGLFPDAPIVFISEAKDIESMGLRPNMTGLLSEIDVKGTLDVALELHPDTQRIAVVSGDSEMDRLFEAGVRQVFQDYENRFEFIDLTGRPMDEILAEAAQLPEHTIVFYVLTLVDGAGDAFIPKEILSSISQASNAPVYGLWDSLLGSGIVGGHLSSAEVEGSKAAEMGLRILGGERPEDIPITQGSHAYMFDWRQLQRWGIDESDLPAGSVVRYKDLSFWELYKWRIIGVAALLAFEALLIFALLIQRSRLQRTEVALRKSRDQLELRVEERTAELAQANQGLQTEIAERRQVEQEIESILDHLPALVFYKDKENNFVKVNKYVADAYEMTKKELEGTSLFDIYPKDTAQAYWDDDLEVINSRKPKLNIDEPWTTEKGTKWVTTSKIPFVDKKGAIQGVIGISIDTTKRKRAEEAVRKARDDYRATTNLTEDVIVQIDTEGRWTFLNDRACEFWDRPREELMGSVFADNLHPDDQEKTAAAVEDIMGGKIVRGLVNKQKTLDGWRTVLWNAAPIFEDEEYIGFQATGRDITERVQAEDALQESEERLGLALEGTGVGLWDWMVQTGETVFNERWAEIVGHTLEELAPVSIDTWIKLTHPDDLEKSNQLLEKHFAGETDHYVCEARMKHKDGHWVWVLDRGKVFEWDEDGKPVRVAGTHLDITERKRAEDTIRQMAYHDALTGLPNRRLFNDLMNISMARAHRNHEKLAVMLFDLDHFKEVNDTLGHNVGDQLLQVVGERLTSLLRKEDTVARMGGDEFILLLPEISGREGAVEVADRILESIREPYLIADHELRITTSIGIAIYPDHGEDVDTLIKNADIAMYRAKEDGRDSSQPWRPDNQERQP